MYLISLLLGMIITTSVAQQASLAGTWNLKSEGAQGDGWTLNAISGTLTLQQSGDKVVGSWRGPFKEDVWKVEGLTNDGKFELRGELKDISVTRNGAKSRKPARWIFRGNVTANTMSGMMMLDHGQDEAREQRFTAARAR